MQECTIAASPNKKIEYEIIEPKDDIAVPKNDLIDHIDELANINLEAELNNAIEEGEGPIFDLLPDLSVWHKDAKPDAVTLTICIGNGIGEFIMCRIVKDQTFTLLEGSMSDDDCGMNIGRLGHCKLNDESKEVLSDINDLELAKIIIPPLLNGLLNCEDFVEFSDSYQFAQIKENRSFGDYDEMMRFYNFFKNQLGV